MSTEIINFLEATKGELEPLKRLLVHYRGTPREGTIQVRVHDYWLEGHPTKTIPHPPEYSQRRQQYLQACLNSGKVPMLFLEDTAGQETLHERMGVAASLPLFVITTKTGDANLVKDDKNFPIMVDKLRDIGVRKVHMGGQYLVFLPLRYCRQGIDDDEERVELAKIFKKLLQLDDPRLAPWAFREDGVYGKEACLPFGCVGGVGLKLLASHFAVSFSAATSWPVQIMTPKAYDRVVLRGKYTPDD